MKDETVANIGLNYKNNNIKLITLEKKQLSETQSSFCKTLQELLDTQHKGCINKYMTHLFFFSQHIAFPENEILLRKFIDSLQYK